MIKFQDEAAQMTGAASMHGGRLKTRTKSLVTLEIKASIFERALERNPNDERLVTGYMEIYQEFNECVSDAIVLDASLDMRMMTNQSFAGPRK